MIEVIILAIAVLCFFVLTYALIRILPKEEKYYKPEVQPHMHTRNSSRKPGVKIRK